MDLKSVAVKGLGPQPAAEPPARAIGAPALERDASAFKDALGRAADSKGVNPALATSVAKPSVAAQAFAQEVGISSGAGTAGALKFSSHAVERMHSRGISFAPETMRGIEQAVKKAADKGSKDTLVLAGENALIVSVKNNTVVTVMDKNMMKENVFTNIDSTVVV